MAPQMILTIKNNVEGISRRQNYAPHVIDYTEAYAAWQLTEPGKSLVITCIDNWIASRVVAAFYEKLKRNPDFPRAAIDGGVRRIGAVVCITKEAASD